MDPSSTGSPPESSGRQAAGVTRVRVRRKVARGTPRNYLLVLLEREKWLRWAILGCFLLGGLSLFLGLSHWTTSPSGAYPVIRVRLINILYSWNFGHSARQAQSAGRGDIALRAWEESIGYNPANLNSIRGLIQTVTALPQVNRSIIAEAVMRGNLLLALGRTNSSDLDLLAAFYGKYEIYDLATWRFNRTNIPSTPTITLALVKSLFDQGQIPRLLEVWRDRGAGLTNHPEAQLYRLATTAGWGADGDKLDAWDHLKAASSNPSSPALQSLALRLMLRVAFNEVDRRRFEWALSELKDRHEDRLQDHLRHCLLLDATGFQDEARRVAQETSEKPESIADAGLQITVWSRLGMATEAVHFCQTQLPKFRYSPQLCVLLVPLLFENKAWEELRPMAVAIRQDPQTAVYIGGYSHFLEGLAELGASNRKAAAEHFAKYADAPPSDNALVMSSASFLSRNDFGQLAAKILHHIESSQGNSAEFWHQMEMAAFTGRDANLLFTACERTYRLFPTDVTAVNNYAAALLIMREQTSEAVRLTLEVMNARPDSFSAAINHSIALCQIGRPSEGWNLVKDILPSLLRKEDLSTLLYAKFQCLVGLGQVEDAREVAAKLDRATLFQPQIDWLNKTLASLPPSATSSH